MKQVVFGKYTLVRRLVQGGMAELFLARTTELLGVERLVVLKLVASRFAEDQAFLRMFLDEVRIAAMLNHPNIGQVLEVGQVGGRHYLAMEYLYGHDLRAILRESIKRRRRPMPVSIALQVAARLCSALSYAHNARAVDGTPLQIIHRDVSPSNVMITFDGSVKLVDFGIAKAANRVSLTQPGLIKGKVRYLSPEQVMGREIDQRTDIFTLGTTIWEATVGRHLFEGQTDAHVYEAIARGRVDKPSKILPGYPAPVEALVMTALASDPAQRFATAQAMQVEVERVAGQMGVTLSDLTLGRYMQDLYHHEVAAWERAQAQGMSLVEHLVQAGAAEIGSDEVLSHTDQLPTTARPSPAAQAVRARVSSEGEQPSASTAPAKRTKLFGSDLPPLASVQTLQEGDQGEDTQRETLPPALRPANEPPGRQKTLLAGEVRRLTPAPARPDPRDLSHQRTMPAISTGPPPRQMKADPQKGAAAGRQGSSPAPASLAASQGRSTEPSQGTPAEPEQSEERRRTAPWVSGPTMAPPTRAPSKSPMPPASATEQAKPEHDIFGRDLRPRTGDWAHQQTAQEPVATADPRPGTHPYFKGSGATLYPRAEGLEHEQPLEPPRNRLGPVLALSLLGLALIGGAYALWRSSAPTTTASTTDVTDARAASSDPGRARITLTSEPSGATVYSGKSGEELGRTPLALPHAAGSEVALELQLPGYLMQRITLEGDADSRHVTLVRAPTSQPTSQPDRQATPPTADAGVTGPRRRRPRGRSRRTPPPKKTRQKKSSRDLIDPFGDVP